MNNRARKLLSERDLTRVRIEMLRDLTGHEPAPPEPPAPSPVPQAPAKTDLWSALLTSLAVTSHG